jgi:anaphase-promoting complex subunit 1
MQQTRNQINQQPAPALKHPDSSLVQRLLQACRLMLEASVLGSATSPGLLYQSRNTTGRPEARSFPSGSTSSGRSLFASHDDGDGAEEELVWYGQTVLCSRGAEVYRKYTFDEEGEDVAYATFAWFPIPAAGPSTIPLSTPTSTFSSSSSETFGPFQNSQHSIWGAPVLSQSSSTTQLARCFVVFLQTRAHVYFPSGRDVIVHLPFVVDGVWPLHTGGILVQRALEKREKRRMNRGKDVLRGMEIGNMSVLDDWTRTHRVCPGCSLSRDLSTSSKWSWKVTLTVDTKRTELDMLITLYRGWAMSTRSKRE